MSRGELVEIGGSFRIPDVIRKGGARLRRGGHDQPDAARGLQGGARRRRTGMILKVHPSNFRIVGFTEQPRRDELAELARDGRNPAARGPGQRAAGAAPPASSRDEPTVADALGDGADLVTFSGDKLLGGPQAGIAAGRAALRRADAQEPALPRAARRQADARGARRDARRAPAARRARARLPVARMIAAPIEELRARAEAFAAASPRGARPRSRRSLLPGESMVGGGAVPDRGVPTRARRARPRRARRRPDGGVAAAGQHRR